MRASIAFLQGIYSSSTKGKTASDSPGGTSTESDTSTGSAAEDEDTPPVPEQQTETVPIRLSSQTRAEITIVGPIGLREAKKLKKWMETVVTPWVDLMIDELEEDDVEK